jgi:hypothetical protein
MQPHGPATFEARIRSMLGLAPPRCSRLSSTPWCAYWPR